MYIEFPILVDRSVISRFLVSLGKVEKSPENIHLILSEVTCGAALSILKVRVVKLSSIPIICRSPSNGTTTGNTEESNKNNNIKILHSPCTKTVKLTVTSVTTLEALQENRPVSVPLLSNVNV